MKWDKVKNFVFGGGAAVVFVLLMGFIDWRIGVKVDAAINELPAHVQNELKAADKIVNMDTHIATNANGVASNKEDIFEEKRRLEMAFDVLMRPDPNP